MFNTGRIPTWVKWAWLGWLAVWVPIYWQGLGPINFLWFCDIANFIIGIALWIESPLLLSSQAVGVFLLQCVWSIDYLGRLLLGFHLIGGTEYMFDPNQWIAVRILSTFHLFVPLILLWALRRLRYQPQGLWLQTAFAALVFPLSWFAGSELNLNWTWRPFGFEQVWLAPAVFLGLCLPLAFCILYWPSHKLFGWWFPAERSV